MTFNPAFRQLIAATLLAAFHLATAATIAGVVVRVPDGDTIIVVGDDLAQRTIRLAGIDAPEARQAFGDRSKRNLARVVLRRRVMVEWHAVDRYGRPVGHVRIDDIDIGLKQVEAGLAWHYTHYQRERPASERASYGAAERTARHARIGLWADKHPTPPWEFRRIAARSTRRAGVG